MSILDDEDDDDDDEGRQDANDYEVPPQFINRTAETLDQSQRCSTCGELTLKVPIVTKINFFLTISIHCQEIIINKMIT